MPRPVTVRFLASGDGRWQIDRLAAVTGEGLPRAERLSIVNSDDSFSNREPVDWAITAFTSNERYVERAERAILTARQEPLERPEATCAAMLPVRKSDAWWDLPQDERRTILEDRSHHIRTGLDYLPAIARRLYHCRDLGEPFDFVTWFEFAPAASAAFEELLGRLRATEEWSFVQREVDVRLSR